MEAKKIHAEFFKTKAGNEPVKDELRKIGRPVKTTVAEDIRYVEIKWKVGAPYVKTVKKATKNGDETVYEVRSTVARDEYRTLFFVYKAAMVLVSFFKKTTKKTPKHEIDLAVDRMREWKADLI